MFLRNPFSLSMTCFTGVLVAPDSISSGKGERGIFEQMGLFLKKCFTLRAMRKGGMLGIVMIHGFVYSEIVQ